MPGSVRPRRPSRGQVATGPTPIWRWASRRPASRIRWKERVGLSRVEAVRRPSPRAARAHRRRDRWRHDDGAGIARATVRVACHHHDGVGADDEGVVVADPPTARAQPPARRRRWWWRRRRDGPGVGHQHKPEHHQRRRDRCGADRLDSRQPRRGCGVDPRRHHEQRQDETQLACDASTSPPGASISAVRHRRRGCRRPSISAVPAWWAGMGVRPAPARASCGRWIRPHPVRPRHVSGRVRTRRISAT